MAETLNMPDVLGRPPRPSRRDEDVLALAASALAEDLDHHSDETDLDETRRQILHALRRTHSTDGYQLARHLEDEFMWCPSAETVDVLDHAHAIIHRALRERTKVWVAQNHVVCTLPLGAAVCVTVQGVEHDGLVVGFNRDEATYTVRVPALGHVSADQLGVHGIVRNAEDLVEAVHG